MSKTKRLRLKIKDFLRKYPGSNSKQIHYYLNETLAHGTTINQLTNILSKDPQIVKVGTERIGATLGGSYVCCKWAMKPEE